MGYQHIPNLYKEQAILAQSECYALEKIHGTSAHIKFKAGSLPEILLREGVVKWDPENIGEFVKSLRGTVFLPCVIVQSSFESEFFWVVSGSDAIVCRRPMEAWGSTQCKS